jgi:hypothetical protein
VKFFLDENFPPQVSRTLQSVYGGPNSFTSCMEDGDRYRDVDDVDLFKLVAADGFNAFITHDRMQMRRQDERAAMHDTGMHWISVKLEGLAGLHGIAVRSAAILQSLKFILDEWPSDPHSFRIKGPGQQASQLYTSAPIARR